MNLLTRAFSVFSAKSAPVPREFEQVMALLDGGMGFGSRRSKVRVNWQTALEVVTVWACVRALANGVAVPELHVYRDDETGKRVKQVKVPEYRLLNRRPSEFQTSMEFRRTMTMHAALTGNAYALKNRDSSGRVIELIPMMPHNVHERRMRRYEILFDVHDEFGFVGSFEPKDILHIPNFQWDAVKGLDAVKLAAKAIGISVAAEDSQENLQAGDNRPPGILTTETKLTAEAVERIKTSWASSVASNSGSTAILDSGFKYMPLAMTAVDAQHIETRKFQVEEICRAFGVFPQIIGHSDKTATFASSEAFFAAHVRLDLMPWHRLWCERLDEFVLDGAGPLYTGFDIRPLLMGSMKDRAVWARTMAELGIYTRNELREEEGLDRLPGLDEPLTPMNMASQQATSSEGSGDGPL